MVYSVSLWRFSLLVNYHFTLNLKIILYVAKVMNNFVIKRLPIKDFFFLLSSRKCCRLYDLVLISSIG